MDITEYYSNFYKGTKNPNLDAMKHFMNEFNHPEKDLKFIHIAGTNGKGSIAESMTNILINAGYKVGKFISPHLVKYNERTSIQNINISDDEMEELIDIISPKIDEYGIQNMTLFEVETVMALLYFSKHKCDIVVMETGLGGTYDCTNIISPLVSVISSIGMDHMNFLGSTLSEIAENKFGIIKDNSNTVFFEQSELNNRIKEICNEKNNELHLVQAKDISHYLFDELYQRFDYKNYKDIQINLKGEKQVINACLCIECTQILNKNGFEISEECLRKSLKTVIHKGRFEVLSEKPKIIYDGAHNKPAIENFVKSIDMYYKNEKHVYIISILKTKDYRAVIKELIKDKDAVFIFTDGNDKNSYVSKEEMLNEAQSFNINNTYVMDLEEAIKIIPNKYSDYITFIVGSFYIYGDVEKYLRK